MRVAASGASSARNHSSPSGMPSLNRHSSCSRSYALPVSRRDRRHRFHREVVRGDRRDAATSSIHRSSRVVASIQMTERVLEPPRAPGASPCASSTSDCPVCRQRMSPVSTTTRCASMRAHQVVVADGAPRRRRTRDASRRARRVPAGPLPQGARCPGRARRRTRRRRRARRQARRRRSRRRRESRCSSATSGTPSPSASNIEPTCASASHCVENWLYSSTASSLNTSGWRGFACRLYLTRPLRTSGCSRGGAGRGRGSCRRAGRAAATGRSAGLRGLRPPRRARAPA